MRTINANSMDLLALLNRGMSDQSTYKTLHEVREKDPHNHASYNTNS
jgi:hypothetical protein